MRAGFSATRPTIYFSAGLKFDKNIKRLFLMAQA